MTTTCHSEYLPIKKVFLKTIKDGFVSQSRVKNQWKELNYLSEPNFDEAINEYQSFLKIFSEEEIMVDFFSKNETTMMDSIYCRDASIATDFGMIVCSMGKDGRVHEPEAQEKNYKNSDIEILGNIEFPGTVEGGDVAWLDQKTLAVGHTYRTNKEGIKQLRELLEPKGVEVVVVDLPHYKGKSDVFHLMSILSPVAKDIAVVYSPLMPIGFRDLLINKGYALVEVPGEEFESMGCNVLAISPKKCVMVEGNPITKERLEKVGCKVITYKGSEISVKGGGGPTCLTRPLERMLI